jgi:tripartite-type tricarboxylate transporter receptor subunit TctC
MSGFGSPDHITVNYFATKGLTFKAVPFAEPSERYSSLLGGHTDVLYSPVGNVRSFVEGKQMHPILFFTSARLPSFANVPSSKESGYDITLQQRRAIIIRANTPPERIKVLADALAKVTTQERYGEFLKREHAQPDSFVATEAARKVMESDVAQMTRIVQATQGK